MSARYDLALPEDDQPDGLVVQLLQLLLPPGVSLDRLEDQFARLQSELQQIEHKIKGHVEEIRSTVETEARRRLAVAMPRPVDIPDSICHLLTPLAQGVTHIHLYRRDGNGEGESIEGDGGEEEFNRDAGESES